MNTYAAMAMIVYVAAGGISTGFADDAAVAGTRESFNQNWRFARFGDMPDGSRLAEPGMAGIGATASSEEAENGNVAARAFDGNSDTRWCAANGGEGQWLRLDLGRSAPLSAGACHCLAPSSLPTSAAAWLDSPITVSCSPSTETFSR